MSIADIADTLGGTFLYFSCSRNYSEKFKNIRKQANVKLNMRSLNDKKHNDLFNVQELIKAIEKSQDTATAPDEIHY